MTTYVDADTVAKTTSKHCRKFRCERHKKACKKCKYGQCLIDCANCKINPFNEVLLCPCLNFDDSPKGSRCTYFEEKDK